MRKQNSLSFYWKEEYAKTHTDLLNINIQPIGRLSVQSRFDYMKIEKLFMYIGGKEKICVGIKRVVEQAIIIYQYRYFC